MVGARWTTSIDKSPLLLSFLSLLLWDVVVVVVVRIETGFVLKILDRPPNAARIKYRCNGVLALPSKNINWGFRRIKKENLMRSMFFEENTHSTLQLLLLFLCFHNLRGPLGGTMTIRSLSLNI